MKAPLEWLKEFVDIDIPTQELCERMIMHGVGVEGVERAYAAYDGVVVGQLKSIKKHPNADKLRICQVDIGARTVQIVTGAPNVYEGMVCPVATAHSLLPTGQKIEPGELRGESSNGMLCSGAELQVKEEEVKNAGVDGIMDLGEAMKDCIGQPFFGAVGLDQEVIDFEISANRGDCMSMLGIAREIAAALGVPVRVPEIQVEESGQESVSDYVSIDVQEKELCPRYIARVLTDIHIGESPMWMQRRLIAAGMRPINNMVDITNYVMLEIGQPMHAFDYASVQDGRIIVRRGRPGEPLTTLDGKSHTLDDSMLVIADPKGAIGLAGVMGGENSEITDNTRMVILESANFNGPNNRHTSRALGILSEASQRYTKGIDCERVSMASERAAQLLTELGAGKVLPGRIDTLPQGEAPHLIEARPERINAILGTEIPAEEMKTLLEREGFIIAHKEKGILQCTIPAYRQDLGIEEDIAEEVARLYGYDRIPLLPLAGSQQGGLTVRQQQTERLRMLLCDMGLHESMTMALVGQVDYDLAGYAKEDPKRDCVTIMNPLSEDYRCVRTTVVPSMCKALSLNDRNKTLDCPLYEISNVHSRTPDAEGLPTQKQVLCLGVIGEKFAWLKGVLDVLCQTFGIPAIQYRAQGGASYHPMRKAELFLHGKKIGEMGELHPHTMESLGMDHRACVAELELDPLFDAARTQMTYQPLPKYPAMERDLAVSVDRHTPVGPMMECIEELGGDVLEHVALFDIYQGAQAGEGKKSVAFTLSLRAKDRTLKDEEANVVFDRIVKALDERFGAKLRGM